MNDTPTTDARWETLCCSGQSWYLIAEQMMLDCRQKERELTPAREEIAEWRILNSWGGTPEIINDFIKGQQTRIYYERNLEEDLTLAQEEIAQLKSQLTQNQGAVTISRNGYVQELEEQRDRLAEALRKIKNAGGGYDDPYDELDFIDDITYEALQSLNQVSYE